MKKFRFNLEAPLKVKKIHEDLCKQKLAEAIRRKLKAEEHLSYLISAEAKAKDDLKDKLLNSVKVEDLCLFDTYIYDLNSCIQIQKTALNNATLAYDQCRNDFMRKRKDRQVIEKIKEKRYMAYLKEINSDEQKISDELALAVRMFKKGGGP